MPLKYEFIHSNLFKKFHWIFACNLFSYYNAINNAIYFSNLKLPFRRNKTFVIHCKAAIYRTDFWATCYFRGQDCWFSDIFYRDRPKNGLGPIWNVAQKYSKRWTGLNKAHFSLALSVSIFNIDRSCEINKIEIPVILLNIITGRGLTYIM